MRVRAGQVLAAQVVAVAVVVAAVGPTWVLVGVAVLAVAILLATFGRVSGRWWFEIIVAQVRLHWRRRRAAARVVDALVAGEERPLPWLRALAPELRIRDLDEFGVGVDDDGWFAVVRVEDRQTGEWVPEPASLGVSCVQVGPRWVAVRLTRSDAPATEADGVGPARRVASAALRVAELYGGSVLDAPALSATLIDSLLLDEPPQEHWWGWQSGRLVHVSYVLDRVVDLPVRAQVRTYTADDPRPAVLARVTAVLPEVDAACAEVERIAADAGVRLRRLDGDHAHAAYAGAPTGVPAQLFTDRPAAPRPGA